jgi:hypothetical protein
VTDRLKVVARQPPSASAERTVAAILAGRQPMARVEEPTERTTIALVLLAAGRTETVRLAGIPTAAARTALAEVAVAHHQTVPKAAARAMATGAIRPVRSICFSRSCSDPLPMTD